MSPLLRGERRAPDSRSLSWAEELEALTSVDVPSSPPARTPVIAVGSGKGGVGKTVVSSSLAAALAGSARGEVVAIDVDLGGANLHNGLGLPRPDFALNRFLLENRSLAELVAPTGIPGLRFIGGASDIVGLSEFGEADQRRFLSELGSLPAKATVLDLGAGSSLFNLDLFSSADHPLLVLTPEPTAVQNAYGFLRAATYRRLRAEFRGEEGLHEIIEASMNHRRPNEESSIPALIHEITRYNRAAARRLEETLARISVLLVVNLAERDTSAVIGERFIAAVRRHLGVGIELLGGVARDDAVARSIGAWRPLLIHEPEARAARELRTIASRLSDRLFAARSRKPQQAQQGRADGWRWEPR